MQSYYADLHIHIGRTESGNAVKISASNQLTFRNIAHEASNRKGMDIIGIIDCHAPSVQRDIAECLERGEMEELKGGGIRYGSTTVILGSEIEVRDPGCGAAHLLVYMPSFDRMRDFTEWMRKHLKNIELSSQRIYVAARILQERALSQGGIFVPAHIFTPHKGLYGAASDRMDSLLDPAGVAAVELGLSADSLMAGYLSELDSFTFLTNSDAHSLGKIGREYNRLKLAEPTFEELVKALRMEDGRAVTANYGLDPKLGKYHRTYCASCEFVLDESQAAVERCLYCGSNKIVYGVLDRILAIADRDHPYVPSSRPPYYHQVPLEFIPGLGPKTLEILLSQFQTEMNILHNVSYLQLVSAAGESVASAIITAREGRLALQVGGGGAYGKVIKLS
jgi:uncharacterized protein (TIGR00375 family)